MPAISVQPTGTKPTSSASPKGPLAKLYNSDKYDFTSRTYPIDLASDGRGHYVNFYINVNNSSEYLKKNKWVIVNQKSSAQQGQQVRPGQQLVSGNFTGVPFGETLNTAKNTVNSIQQAVVGRNTKRITQAISMYMPDSQVVATYNFDWQSSSLTEALGNLGFGAQAMKSLTNVDTGSIKGALNSVATDPFYAELAGKIGSTVGLTGNNAGDFLMYASGHASNPQLEVLFRGIGFREFQFVFFMSPKSPQEAQNCLDIIKTFKFHASPELSTQSRYWIMPSEFDIQFIHNGPNGAEENTNIHKISTCIITNIDVNYAQNGVWSTFYDGVPTQIMLTLQFKEVEQITRQRIDQGY